MSDVNTDPTLLDIHQALSKSDGCTLNDAKTMEGMADIPFQEAIGSLLYAAICTCPNITFTVQMCSQFLSNPGPKHWTVVKCVIWYLKDTVDFGLTL